MVLRINLPQITRTNAQDDLYSADKMFSSVKLDNAVILVRDRDPGTRKSRCVKGRRSTVSQS